MSGMRKRFRRVLPRLRLERLEERWPPAVLSLRIGLGSSSVADTGIAAATPDTPQGSGAAILVEASAQGPARQGLVRFDALFGSGAGQIPIGSTITSASLAVWVGQSASTLAPIELHRMLTAWNPA